MEKIGNKYNILGNTLYCITTGKRRKELTKNFNIDDVDIQNESLEDIIRGIYEEN